MEKLTQNLGFRLTTSSILLAFATIFVVGYFVYNQSQVAIQNNSLDMVREVAHTVRQPDASGHFEDYLRRYVTSRSGGAWLMDENGNILASTYPKFGGVVPDDITFSNTIFRLQRGKKLDRFGDAKRTQVHMITPRELIKEYEEGIAEYNYLDTTRIVAFKVIPENGWLVAVEKPVGIAYSELQNIKKYIIIVCIISIIMVSVFSWLAISKIIQPYYKDVEDLNAKLSDTVKRLSALHKVSRSIQQILPLDEMLEKSMRGIAEALGYDRILLHLKDDEKNTAKLQMILVGDQIVAPEKAPQEIRELECKKKNGVIERAIVEQKEYLIKNAMKSDLVNKDRLKILGTREFAVVPLVSESRCIGAITVDNPSSGVPILPEEIETLSTFADQVSLAIARSQLHTELHNYATDIAATDSLTGLFNWSHFVKWLEDQIATSSTRHSALSVIWFQAHHLQEINKKFGYAAGNITLRQLGRIISSYIEEGQVGARFGGGEFVIGLPSCTEEQAKKIVDDLTKRAAALSFAEEGLEGARLQATATCTEHKHDESVEGLLERARRLLASQLPD